MKSFLKKIPGFYWLLFWAICATLFLSAADNRPSDNEKTKVIRVIDGDTIEIAGGQTVRYIGIDTPEIANPDQQILVNEYLVREGYAYSSTYPPQEEKKGLWGNVCRNSIIK